MKNKLIQTFMLLIAISLLISFIIINQTDTKEIYTEPTPYIVCIPYDQYISCYTSHNHRYDMRILIAITNNKHATLWRITGDVGIHRYTLDYTHCNQPVSLETGIILSDELTLEELAEALEEEIDSLYLLLENRDTLNTYICEENE